MVLSALSLVHRWFTAERPVDEFGECVVGLPAVDLVDHEGGRVPEQLRDEVRRDA